MILGWKKHTNREVKMSRIKLLLEMSEHPHCLITSTGNEYVREMSGRR